MRYHGLSRDKAMLYGLPHIGAHYAQRGRKWGRDGARRYERTQEWCCVCGLRATNCHHVVPVSTGAVFDHDTPDGPIPVRSPLFALCGSGTTGCHGRFHSRELVARWVWDDPEYEEAWESGELLRRYPPHHPALYCYGCWEIEDTRTGETFAYRERY